MKVLFRTGLVENKWSGPKHYFSREIELPFTPFIGLQISIDEWEDTVKEISWDGEKIECWTENWMVEGSETLDMQKERMMV